MLAIINPSLEKYLFIYLFIYLVMPGLSAAVGSSYLTRDRI